ncbi:MAG: PASTA domain-containing protein [Actinobacteria bacterium]|nr:PASTA domain-containing protein [Actinomycetota bacterium]
MPAEPGVDDVFDPADEFPEHAPAVGGSRRWFLALLVVMAVGGGVLAWYNTRPETSVVPELAGLRQGAALNQLGPFEATIIEEASETVEPGVVIRSEPAAGTTLENGSKITLVVSTGPAPRALPELVGLTLADATAQLGELGLVLIEAEPQFDEVVVPGVVLSWSVPAAPTLGVGATVTKGTTVQVVLSAGPAPRSVPALAGLTFEDATKVLQDLGLVIFRVPDEFDVNVPAGTVIRQDIPAGSAVERGAQVSVAVSKGQDVIVMPALAGLDYNTIVAALQGAGFVIGSVVGDTTQAFQSATVNAAPVVDAQQFLRGTKVDLTFAPTPAPVVTIVPGG